MSGARRAVVIAASLVVVLLAGCSSGRGGLDPGSERAATETSGRPTATTEPERPSATFVPVPTARAYPQVVDADYDCGPDGTPAVIAEVEVSGPPGSRVRILLRVQSYEGAGDVVVLGRVIVELEPGDHEVPIELSIPARLGDPATIVSDIVMESPPGTPPEAANHVELVLPPGVRCAPVPVPTPDDHGVPGPTVNPA